MIARERLHKIMHAKCLANGLPEKVFTKGYLLQPTLQHNPSCILHCGPVVCNWGHIFFPQGHFSRHLWMRKWRVGGDWMLLNILQCVGQHNKEWQQKHFISKIEKCNSNKISSKFPYFPLIQNISSTLSPM